MSVKFQPALRQRGESRPGFRHVDAGGRPGRRIVHEGAVIVGQTKILMNAHRHGGRLGDFGLRSQAGSRSLDARARPSALPYSAAPAACLSSSPSFARTSLRRIAKGAGGRSKSRPRPARLSMPLDVHSLQSFYGSPLGGVARRLIGRVIRERWEQQRRPLRRRGRLWHALSRTVPRRRSPMPGLDAGRAGRRRSGRKPSVAPRRWSTPQMLPLPDGSIDRLLLAHALEAADRPDALLEELWRITAPEGRMIVIVPSRRGVWARTDSTPYGQGLPYSKSQLRDLASSGGVLADLLGRGALCAAGRQAFHDPLRADDRTARSGAWTAVRGRPYRRGDQAGPSPGRRPRGRPGAAALRSIRRSRRAPSGNAIRE